MKRNIIILAALVVLVLGFAACEPYPEQPVDIDSARATVLALTPTATPWLTPTPQPTSAWNSHPHRNCGLSTVECGIHKYVFKGINAEGMTFFEYVINECRSPYGDQAFAYVMGIPENSGLYALTAQDWYNVQVFYVPGDMMCPVGNLAE